MRREEPHHPGPGLQLAGTVSHFLPLCNTTTQCTCSCTTWLARGRRGQGCPSPRQVPRHLARPFEYPPGRVAPLTATPAGDAAQQHEQWGESFCLSTRSRLAEAGEEHVGVGDQGGGDHQEDRGDEDEGDD